MGTQLPSGSPHVPYRRQRKAARRTSHGSCSGTRQLFSVCALRRGRHIQEDIPALVAAARQHLPAAVDCVIADPIGIDGLMAQLIENRVRAAESRS